MAEVPSGDIDRLLGLIRAEVDRAAVLRQEMADERFHLLQEELDRRFETSMRELRTHGETSQLQLDQRIADIAYQRDLLKNTIDGRMGIVDGRLTELLKLLQEEIDRRFETIFREMNQRFDASDKAVQAALASADRATNKAESAAEKRFDSVNEFRQTLADQTKTFVTQDKFGGLDVRVDDLRDRVTTIQSLTQGITSVTGTGYEASQFRQVDSIAAGVRGRAQIALVIASSSALVAILGLILTLVFHATK